MLGWMQCNRGTTRVKNAINVYFPDKSAMSYTSECDRMRETILVSNINK